MSEHLSHCSSPLRHADFHKPSHSVRRRRPSAPCCWLCSQCSCILRDELPALVLVMTEEIEQASRGGSLLVDLLQHEPAVIPAAHAIWISHDQCLRFVESFGAERVILSEPSEFVEKIVGVDIVSPSSSHRLGHFARVKVSKNLFDPPQLCNCIDLVGSQRIDKLFFVVLETESVKDEKSR